MPVDLNHQYIYTHQLTILNHTASSIFMSIYYYISSTPNTYSKHIAYSPKISYFLYEHNPYQSLSILNWIAGNYIFDYWGGGAG